MGKYYVITDGIDESYDWELYYDEDTAEQDRFALIENREIGGLNTDLYRDILTNLDHLYYDLQEDPDYDEDEDAYTEEEAWKGLAQLANDYCEKYNASKLTMREVLKLIDLATEYAEASSLTDDDEADFMCDYLEIQWGEPFKHGIMRGSSQSDWVRYICPASLSDEYLAYIEAVIMADGMMAYVTETEIEDPVKELPDSLYDGVNEGTLSDYYLPWMSDQYLKNYFAKEFGKPASAFEVIDKDEYDDILQAREDNAEFEED